MLVGGLVGWLDCLLAEYSATTMYIWRTLNCYSPLDTNRCGQTLSSVGRTQSLFSCLLIYSTWTTYCLIIQSVSLAGFSSPPHNTQEGCKQKNVQHITSNPVQRKSWYSLWYELCKRSLNTSQKIVVKQLQCLMEGIHQMEYESHACSKTYCCFYEFWHVWVEASWKT